MKKHKLHIIMALFTVLITSTLFAQDWVSKMQDPSVNFYEVQKAFDQYAAKYKADYRLANNGAEPTRIPGKNQYKRWEWFTQPRVSSSGERMDPSLILQEIEQYRKGVQNAGAGNWSLLGPVNTSSLSGAGRLNFVRIHPTQPNTIFVGSPSGGLWKSTDGGSNWTTNTDLIAQVIGCTDIAIDPVNTNIMYLATGDGDAGDNYSVGLLKSTDGGTTWNKTGLTNTPGQFKQLSKVLINPTTTSTILVATSTGVYRSTDAGATFTLTQTGNFKDMEFKPGDPNTVYVCGIEFFKSTTGGATWTKISAGLPASTAICRMAIAVSAADANYIYMTTGLPAPTYGNEGFYKSTNGGTSFTKLGTTPNIGNQQWYDLCIAASPTNAQEVLLGGQTQFMKTTNGGTSWSQIATTTHVDYHDVIYTSGTTAYMASDGGIYKTTDGGSNWDDLSNGLVISQMYGFGHSATAANKFIYGWQDNGTNVTNGTTHTAAIGGDGMKAFISHGNDQNMWGETQYGGLRRSTNGGMSFTQCTAGITEFINGNTGPGPWVAEWNEDPTTANTIYVGFNNVWKSTTGGTSWTKMGTVSTSTVYVQAIAAVPTTNGQTVWAAKGGTLHKTTNGGTNWTAITTLPGGTISDIICHPTNTQKAWVSFSGFSNSVKVFQTTDQGATWTNLSASIPNVPVNCMAIDKNGNDALYIGTDIGVFFKDATMNIWQPFSQGLPIVEVTQIEMYYAGSKVRASTYGRGLWESPLYTPGAYPPDANFTANNLIGCPGLGVQFTDYSSGQPTSWSWSFPGGNPSSSTAQHPFVAYNTPGTYSVTLTATNANGTNSETFTNYITVSSSPNAAPTASGKNFCGPNTLTLTAIPSVPGSGTVRWWNQAAGGSIVGTGNSFTTPTLTGTTSYFVDQAFPAGATEAVGETDRNVGAGAMFSANDIRGLDFQVLNPVVINTVSVSCATAAMRTIEILDVNGNMVTDTTLNIPASPSALIGVTINRTVYPGTYFMKFRGTVDCWRNSDGAQHPYTSSAIHITGTNAGTPGYYYFFYNWQYTNLVCNTGRTTVALVDTCSTVAVNDLFSNGGSLNVYPNPNNGQFAVSFTIEKQDNYTVKITNTIGQTVYEEALNNFTGTYSNKIDIASFGKGVYMLNVSNSRNETVKKVIVY